MNPYIQSLRLRTLPLSVAGIVLGTGLAFRESRLVTGDGSLVSDPWSWVIFGLAVLTALSLQILSNLSNELGDAMKGTDTDQHGREAYGLQAGTITAAEMKKMIGLFIGLSVVFGTALVLTAFWGKASEVRFQDSVINILVFLGLGALAIAGAMTYTLGKHSYGYMGLGDLGVFLFFGLLSTMGAYYLQTQTMTWEACACGMAIGLPCVGVLNLNNIRDIDNDRAHGKRTLASRMGAKGSKVYHTAMLVACMSLFVLFGHYWAVCVLPVWAWHVWYVWTHEGSALDIQMPVLMLSTGVLSCLGWV
jgi:1,4-dihydroxy-2-naphthoate octaprenyltransferase